MNEEHKDNESKPILNVPASDLPIKPITLNEVEDEIKKRVSYIEKEFTNGFDFIKNQAKSVTFFGSSRFTPENKYYQIAASLAGKLAKEGYTVLSGGGPGIMEGASKGAKDAGGTSLGLTIKLPHQQSRNPFLTDYRDFYYFFTRKVMLSFSAEAYVFLPGGYGTLDEFFEILTLVQTNKIERVPIYVVGSDYWKPLLVFIEEVMLKQFAAVDTTDLKLFEMCDNEDEIVTKIKTAPIRNGVRIPDGYGN